MKRLLTGTATSLVAGLLAFGAAQAQMPDVPPVGSAKIEDFGQWRSPYFFFRMDRSTQMEMPELTVQTAIEDSRRALLVVSFYYDGGRYSNYQQALLRRILFYLSSQLKTYEVRLLEVMVASADGRPVYDKELFKYYASNTLGEYGGTIGGKPVMPYGQVYLAGELVYDFSVMWEARDDDQVAENARAIQSSMLRIANEAKDNPPPPEPEPDPAAGVREPDLSVEAPEIIEREVIGPPLPRRAPPPQAAPAPARQPAPEPAPEPVKEAPPVSPEKKPEAASPPARTAPEPAPATVRPSEPEPVIVRQPPTTPAAEKAPTAPAKPEPKPEPAPAPEVAPPTEPAAPAAQTEAQVPTPKSTPEPEAAPSAVAPAPIKVPMIQPESLRRAQNTAPAPAATPAAEPAAPPPAASQPERPAPAAPTPEAEPKPAAAPAPAPAATPAPSPVVVPMIQPESRIPPTRRKSVLPFEVIEDPAPPNTTNEAAPSELEPRLPEGPQAVEPPPE